MLGRNKDVELVVLLDRVLIMRRANETLGQEGSATFYDNGARRNSSFNQSAPGNPYTAGAFEVSHSLPMNCQITGPYWASELQASFVFNNNGSRTHLAA